MYDSLLEDFDEEAVRAPEEEEGFTVQAVAEIDIVDDDAELDVAALRAHCARQLPSEFVPVHTSRAAAIPRNAMGRIDRGALVNSSPKR